MFPTARLSRLLVALPIVLALSNRGIAAPEQQGNRSISAAGVIDRVVTAGAEPVYRASGYRFRVTAATQVHFRKGLQTLNEVNVNMWASFEGLPDDSGTITATKADFTRLKMSARKPDPNAVQLTKFPAGGKIDADLGFAVGSRAFPAENHGGWCGWYDLPTDAAEQERIRLLGMKLVPSYQREPPDGDPAKIPFRFYAVSGTSTRSAIFCDNGLVLIPEAVIQRLTNVDQLAAVMADAVAGEMLMQAGHAIKLTQKDWAEMAAVGAAADLVGGVLLVEVAANHVVKRRLEEMRGRMALALMDDAGFDPRQAPEAWRMLAPSHAPKDPGNLKDTERSKYLDSFLEQQYKYAKRP
jgi:hypothetical protein